MNLTGRPIYQKGQDKPRKPVMHILSHPNIPKPLHGVNPRSIMGSDQWDKVRSRSYASTNFHCLACGVHKSKARKHQWLEAHEDFDVDYNAQTVTIRRIIPLCHFCHAFIHSGLLHKNARSGKVSYSEARQILRHGIGILEGADAPIFAGTKALADMAGIDTSLPITDAPKEIPWEGWRMIWEGEEYPQKFKTFEAWRRHYS